MDGNSRKPRPAGTGSLQQVRELMMPHRGRIAAIMAMLMALTAVNMALPAFIKLLIDEVFPHKNWSLLGLVLAGIVGVYVTRNVLYFFSKYNAVSMGEQVAFKLRKRLFEHLQRMNLQFYRQNPAGKMSSRVLNDSTVIQNFIQDELPKLLQSLLLFTALLAVLFAVNWSLAIACSIVLPLHLATFFYFKRPIKAYSKLGQEQLDVVQGNMIEKFLGAEVVKGFNAEDRESASFVQAIAASRDKQLQGKKYHVAHKVTADLLVGLGTIALLGYGAYQVMGPTGMEVGAFVMFFGYVSMLYPNLLQLISGFSKYSKTAACLERAFSVLETGSAELSGTKRLKKPVRGEIRFDHVDVRYPDGPLVLGDISATIPAGRCCAILGPSGVGKSTLVSLLPRLIEPEAGRVFLDDVDVADLDLQDLRETIGIAFQEMFLFDTTVIENLRYARPDATDAEIRQVARRTGADEVIQRLPDGYQTVLGEGGVTLSRGEKQRLTLTRAMLKNPRILILDEATASIDQPSVEKIIPEILDFMRGKTTLMITHRIELLAHADMVLKLDQGRLAYCGRPPESELESYPLSDHLPAQSGETDGPQDRTGTAGMRAGLIIFGLAAVLLAAATDTGAQSANPQTSTPQTPTAAEVVEPGPFGRFISLDGLNPIEAEELIGVINTRLQTEMGYSPAPESLARKLPRAPDKLRFKRLLAYSGDDGLHLLRLGYLAYLSQPPHLLIDGRTFTDGDQAKANDHLAEAIEIVRSARTSLTEKQRDLKVSDLQMETMNLSYIEADRCLAILKVLGYQTIRYSVAGEKGVGKSQALQPSNEVDVNHLPVVVEVPSTDAAELVGDSQVGGGAFGLSMTPSVASNLPDHTAAAPTMQLMVLYRPGHPEQFSELRQRIRESIDVPAKQILIEAMVLEISEAGLRELGVEWELSTPFGDFDELEPGSRIGRLPNLSADQSTLDIELSDVFGHIRARIRALVREGEAEILSRPSVLTLDNRQASIRVGEDIPVATSAAGVRGGDKISFNFKYLPIGILLNVRPRVADRRNEVSMQIDGIVSAEVPGEELQIIDTESGEVLASAPRISTRRVQTYSRIANNTPFIIGGLVSRDRTSTTEKVPLLGDVPLLGYLFRNERVDTVKREVIIVITPYVLPDNKTIGRNMPKDEDMFDSFGNRLFRDAYRIRAQDVFDLSFLDDNRQLQRMSELADAAVRRDFRLAEQYPFQHFVGDSIPGEHILVYRQMYEVIKRLKIDDRIEPMTLRGGVVADPMIFFQPDPDSVSGFSVRFLWPYLRRQTPIEAIEQYGDGRGVYDWLEDNGKALAVTFTISRDLQPSEVLSRPVPDVRMVDCPDRRAWDRLLGQLNSPDAAGNRRYTILLQNADDWKRLRRSALLKQVVQLNANAKALTRDNFSVGRLLLMPSTHEEKVYLIGPETAKFFYYTEQYYPALQQALTREMRALRQALRDMGIDPGPEPERR